MKLIQYLKTFKNQEIQCIKLKSLKEFIHQEITNFIEIEKKTV